MNKQTIIIPWRDDPDRPALKEIMLVNKRHYEHHFNVLLSDSYHTRFNRSAARNHGVAQTDDEVIVLIDATTKMPADVITDMISLAKQNRQSVLKPVSYELIFPHNMFNTRWDSGRVWVMHRDAWNLVGGFNEAFTTHGYEDLEFLLRACTSAEVIWVHEPYCMVYYLPVGPADPLALKNGMTIYQDTKARLDRQPIKFRYFGTDKVVDTDELFELGNVDRIDQRKVVQNQIDRAHDGLVG